MFSLKLGVLLSLATAVLAQCPKNTYYSYNDGMCYFSYNSSLVWGSALNLCNQLNGELVVPRNAFENSMYVSIVQDFNALETWLGVFSGDDGTWYDFNGKALTYARWAPGEPSRRQASCASMTIDGLWYADDCNHGDRFICKIASDSRVTSKPLTSTTTTTTTTTIPATTTTTITTTTKPTSTTTTTTTKPTTSTTSTTTARPTTTTATSTTTTTTRIPTTTETLPTIDPLIRCPGYNASTQSTPCAKGWDFYLPTCSCYKASTKRMTWYEAEQNCVNLKAHLASVHSQDEAVFIKGMTDAQTTVIHIGLQHIGNQWLWTDGTAIDFLNWDKRDKRSDEIKYGCGVIFTNGWYFSSYMSNVECTEKHNHSVCKKKLI